MIAFVDAHRADYGVEPICAQLPMAPSVYHAHQHRRAHPETAPARVRQDQDLSARIKDAHRASRGLYGVRKIWHQLRQQGLLIGRERVARLMRVLQLRGVSRQRKRVVTTVPASLAETSRDLVQRGFDAPAPNRLWVADITYVRVRLGFVYTAFVIDVYARFIVGWKVGGRLTDDLTLDALEQALWARQPDRDHALIHHSDRGGQYLSLGYTQRLRDAGLSASVGSVGDAYDNALAETVNGLYKTEVIGRRPRWSDRRQVELATLAWVHWFNHERLLEPLGYLSPAQYEQAYYAQLSAAAGLAALS
jgi:transposase InsO family protein